MSSSVGFGAAGSARWASALAIGAGSARRAAAHLAASPLDSQRPSAVHAQARHAASTRARGVVLAEPCERVSKRRQQERSRQRGEQLGRSDSSERSRVLARDRDVEREPEARLGAGGAWRSSRQELLENALNGEYGHLVEPVAPPDDALFVVKARHSIFFQTPLEYLLGQEDVERVVLIGQVTEQCILCEAADCRL
jgi:nicotinamidase-related amidase